MKSFCKTILVLASMILIQSCAKSYEVHFDKLLMDDFEYGFNSPQYLESCCMEIKTKEEFDVNEYMQWSSELLLNYEYEPDYEFIKSWNVEKSGAFLMPNVNACHITIRDNSENKIFELSFDKGAITSLSIWRDGKLMTEAQGEIRAAGESTWGFSTGVMRLYQYTDDGIQYVSKEEKTEGYSTDCTEYYRYTTEYYPSARVYHSIKTHASKYNDEYGIRFEEEILEDVYFNEDGSVMTGADKLFKEHKKYVILHTGHSLRPYGPVYMVLMPKDNDIKRGYGVIIYSQKNNLSSFTPDKTFEYRIDNDNVICDEFYYHTTFYGDGRISGQKRRTLSIYEDDYAGIVLEGKFSIDGWEANCRMTLYHKGYSDWLYDELQKHIGRR